MKSFRPEKIYIHHEAREYPLTQRILARYNDVPLEETGDIHSLLDRLEKESDPILYGKKNLLLLRQKGRMVKRCPGSRNVLCCNYYTFNAFTNCPLDCSYCVLQDYLTNPLITVHVNTDELLEELDTFLDQDKSRIFRLGSGELADSLALEPLTEHAKTFIPFFAGRQNALLELKTKTSDVESLLPLPHGGHTIVAWSLSPPWIIQQEERGTSALAERLRAARQCVEAGYRVAFHFDPIYFFPGWEDSYRQVVDQLFNTVQDASIDWISLGGMRFTPRLKRLIQRRSLPARLLYEEFLTGPDGKLRYFRPIRVEMYKKMLSWIRGWSDKTAVYFCMETEEVWKEVFGHLPWQDPRLENIFDKP